MQIDVFCKNKETIGFRLGLIWSIAKHGATFCRLPIPRKEYVGQADVRETFTSIPYFLETKRGDCVGAATYLCAWHLQNGRFCRPVILRKKDRSLHCAIYLGGQIVETTWIYTNMPGVAPFVLKIRDLAPVSRQLDYMR